MQLEQYTEFLSLVLIAPELRAMRTKGGDVHDEVQSECWV